MLTKYWYKLQKAFGVDTTAVRTYQVPLKQFQLEKEVSTETVEGHFYKWDNGEIVISEANDDEWALATVYPIFDGQALKPVFSGLGFDEVDRVKGVVDVNETVIGEVNWEITVDLAEASIESVDRTELVS